MGLHRLVDNQLALSKLRFAPEFILRFGVEPELAFPQLRLRYSFDVENHYDGPAQLVMEPGSLVGDWQIWVNEQGPLRDADFALTTAHVRGSLGADITRYLRAGSNTIRVEISTDRSDGGLINPLYLAGDFGVALHPLALGPRPQNGQFEDYEGNGLPFYAGVIDYGFEFDLPELPPGDQALLEVETDGPFSEALELSINGGAFTPVLWQPRRALVPVSQMLRGRNQVVARVSTTLIRSFEGQWFDDTTHTYQTI